MNLSNQKDIRNLIVEGNFNEVRSNEEVIESYLGKGIKKK